MIDIQVPLWTLFVLTLIIGYGLGIGTIIIIGIRASYQKKQAMLHQLDKIQVIFEEGETDGVDQR